MVCSTHKKHGHMNHFPLDKVQPTVPTYCSNICFPVRHYRPLKQNITGTVVFLFSEYELFGCKKTFFIPYPCGQF